MAEEIEKETEKRRRQSAEDKARIMSMILLEGKSVSDVADEYRISPNKILNWRKELIEGAAGHLRAETPGHHRKGPAAKD